SESQRHDEHDPSGEEPEERTDGARPPKRGDGSEGENRTPYGKRCAAGERHDAVHPDENTRRGQPVQAEERGHDRERTADKHRVAVAPAGAAAPRAPSATPPKWIQPPM